MLGDKSSNRLEIAGVLYDTNVLGFKGPRRMTGKYFEQFRDENRIFGNLTSWIGQQGFGYSKADTKKSIF